MGPNLGFDPKNINLGAGDILYTTRGASAVTLTPTGTPTTTTFSIVTADDGEKVRVGDVLMLTSDTATYTADEASSQPRVTSAVANGTNTDITVSPAFGSAPDATSGTVKILYKMLGATDGGITIKATVKRSPQTIDQSPFPVANPVTDITAVIMAPLAESTAQHFALALGIAANSDSAVLQMGSAPDLSREDRILTVTPGENGGTRYTVAHKCVSDGDATFTASKTQKGIINLNLTMMPDTDFDPAGVFDMKTV